MLTLHVNLQSGLGSAGVTGWIYSKTVNGSLCKVVYVSVVMWKPCRWGSGDSQVFTSSEGLRGSSVGQEQSLTFQMMKHTHTKNHVGYTWLKQTCFSQVVKNLPTPDIHRSLSVMNFKQILVHIHLPHPQRPPPFNLLAYSLSLPLQSK